MATENGATAASATATRGAFFRVKVVYKYDILFHYGLSQYQF